MTLKYPGFYLLIARIITFPVMLFFLIFVFFYLLAEDGLEFWCKQLRKFSQ